MASTLTRAPRLHRPRPAVAIASVGALVVVCGLWGLVLSARGVALHLGFIPFYGAFDVRLTPGVVLPVLAAVLIVTAGPNLAGALTWRRLLLGGWAASVLWSVALAVSTGVDGLTGPLHSPYDYWSVVPEVRRHGTATFVKTFLERLPGYPIHVQGHPPGLPVLYGVLDAVGLRGPGWAAAFVIAAGASTIPAVLIATRAYAGLDAARAVAPFLVLAPFALFIATTGDAVFMAATAWSVALLVVAITTRSGRGSDAVALLGGVVGGLALFLTYGVLPLLVAVPGAVALARRRRRPLVFGALGAAGVAIAWNVAGFSWLDGFRATHHFYGLRAGNDRPYSFFVASNLAVFAAMLGPAVLAGFTRLRNRSVSVLVIAAAAAVVVADLSGLSKAEVERIWLPFMPWLTLAVVDLVRDRRSDVGRWLAAQAGLAIAMQVVIAWPW